LYTFIARQLRIYYDIDETCNILVLDRVRRSSVIFGNVPKRAVEMIERFGSGYSYTRKWLVRTFDGVSDFRIISAPYYSDWGVLLKNTFTIRSPIAPNFSYIYPEINHKNLAYRCTLYFNEHAYNANDSRSLRIVLSELRT